MVGRILRSRTSYLFFSYALLGVSKGGRHGG